MTDPAYVVRVQYRVDDGASGPIQQIGEKSKKAAESGSKMGSVFSGVADRISGAFDAVVSKVAMGATAAAAAAAIAGAKMIKTGISVNAQLEDSSMAFASMFNMFGVTSSFEAGLSPAKKLIEGIRKDAADLPGEFQDFVSMAQNITPSMMRLGKSVADVRSNVSLLAVTAASVGLKGKAGFEQAANEYAELLSGRAGTHNKLGVRLGIDTHTKVGGLEFNKADAQKRYDFLQEMLKRGGAGKEAFGRSWGGMTSTLSDNFKSSMGRVTAPLMDRMKETMGRFLGLSDAHAKDIGAIENIVASKLVSAYDWLEKKTISMVKHWRDIASVAQATGHTIGKIYDKVAPIVGGAAKAIYENPSDTLTALVGARAGMSAMSYAVPAATTAGGALAGAATAGAGVAVSLALIDNVGGSVSRFADILRSWGSTFMTIFDGLFGKGTLFRDILGGIGAVLIFINDVALLPFKLQLDLVGAILKGINSLWQALKDELFGVDGALRSVGDAFTTAWNAITSFVSAVRNIAMPDGNEGPGKSLIEWRDLFLERQLFAPARDYKNAMNYGMPIAMALMGAASSGGQSQSEKSLDELKSTMKGMAGSGKTNVTVNAPLTVLSDADPDRIAKGVAVHVRATLQAPLRSITGRNYLDG